MSQLAKDSPPAEKRLREQLGENTDDWEARKALARLLYDRGDTREAAELVWEAPEIPSVDFEIAYAARILAKGTPRRAIRLLTALLEQNRDKPVQNLAIANALMHHGMVMQAARFYGAAIEGDKEGDLVNADLEHFLLWVDDRQKIWGDFEDQKDELDELPWIKRDAAEAAALEKALEGHTTPIRVPGLPRIPIEEADNAMYVQSERLGANATPPPAVTIPMDRVAAKDRLYDEQRGAEVAAKKTGPKPIHPPLGAAAVKEETSAMHFNPAPAPSAPRPLMNGATQPTVPFPAAAPAPTAPLNLGPTPTRPQPKPLTAPIVTSPENGEGGHAANGSSNGRTPVGAIHFVHKD